MNETQLETVKAILILNLDCALSGSLALNLQGYKLKNSLSKIPFSEKHRLDIIYFLNNINQ